LKDLDSVLQDLSIYGVQQNGSLSIIEKQIGDLKSKYNGCLGDSRCPIIDEKYCSSCLEKLKL
jgi:hypothetical protein